MQPHTMAQPRALYPPHRPPTCMLAQPEVCCRRSDHRLVFPYAHCIHKSPCAPNMDPPILLMPQRRQFLGPHWLQCLAHAPQKSTPWPGTSIWHLLHSHQSPPAAGAPGSKSVGPLQIQIATAPPATDIGTPLAPAAGTHFTLSHTHGSCQELAHSPSARIHMEE